MNTNRIIKFDELLNSITREVISMHLLDQYKRGNISFEEFHHRLWTGSPEKFIAELGYKQFNFYLLAGPGELYEDIETKLKVMLTAAPPKVQTEMQEYLNSLLADKSA